MTYRFRYSSLKNEVCRILYFSFFSFRNEVRRNPHDHNRQYVHNMSFDRSNKNLTRYPIGSIVKHTWLPKDSLEEQVSEGTVTSYNEGWQTLTVSYDARYDVDSPEGERRELEGDIPLAASVGTTKSVVVTKKPPQELISCTSRVKSTSG